MGLFGWLRAFWAKDAIPPPAADVLGAATLVKEKPPNLSQESLPAVVIPAPVLSAADQRAMQARGYRNRNPGNIDFNARNGWLGQVGLEPPPLNGGRARFAVFEEHEYGIRALARLLMTYGEKHNLRTVAGIINRWAPSNENVTSSYIAFVAKLVGVRPDDPVDVTQYRIARPMVEAIIRKELGGCPYPASVIDEGLKRAGVLRE
jgi:hypothetical protein